MGIVNAVDSLIAREVDCGVYLNAGPEISVASTKSFTSMVIVLSLIQMWFYNSSKSNYKSNSGYNSDSLQKSNNNIINAFKINNLTSLHSTITNLLYDIEFLKSLNDKKNFIMENNINNIFILGKNKLYPIACEGSLKIKEVTYIHSEGFSAGSLKHGPFALLDKTNLTFLLIDYTDVEYYQNLRSTYHEINARNTNLIVITNSENVVKDLNILPENYIVLYSLDYYNEIIFNITLQYLAYIISIEKGINPDKPRNLAKVVTVE
jgi:glucosamine--fructose-6-phosphate aminotransferase (isomerizing)